MTDDSDGPELDLTTTRALAESVAADFAANEKFQREAFDKLSDYLDADNHLHLSLAEAYVFFAEEVSADPKLFSTIVGQFAAAVAREVDQDLTSIDEQE
ncbi:hypothetical protein [Microbacterium binotii]|jgi:hypothetical protein